MQQKVQFVAAVIHQPDLLILDEPFSGLDPVNQRLLRDLVLEEHRRGATVLFSTHVMIARRAALRPRRDDPPRREGARPDDGGDPRDGSIRAASLFEPLDPAADVGALRAVPGVVRACAGRRQLGHRARRAGADPAAVIRARGRRRCRPARIEVRRPTLEDVFVSIVDGRRADGGRRAARGCARRCGTAAREEVQR